MQIVGPCIGISSEINNKLKQFFVVSISNIYFIIQKGFNCSNIYVDIPII